MSKYLPSLLPIVSLVAAALSPAVQGYVVHHPFLSLCLTTASAVLNHFLPSPVK